VERFESLGDKIGHGFGYRGAADFTIIIEGRADSSVDIGGPCR